MKATDMAANMRALVHGVILLTESTVRPTEPDTPPQAQGAQLAQLESIFIFGQSSLKMTDNEENARSLMCPHRDI